MIQFLKENFERNPDLTFIEFRNRKYSNKEFLFQVIHSACILKSYKIPPKGVIGIQISNPFKFLIQWFACNFLGLTSVLLSPKLNGKELQKCLDSTQLKIIITTRNLIGHYSNSNLGLVFVEDSPSISLCGNELDKFDWDENDTATIIFTSGSDGFPKPVELTTANFKSSFNSWNHEIQFDNDKIINFLPLHHIAGISAIFRGLLSRTPIYLMDKFHIDDFIECCKKFNPTIVSLVLKVVYNLFKTED